MVRTGRVLAVDVRKRRFELWSDDGSHLPVEFEPEQEAVVTSALVNHRTVRVRVDGGGDFESQGELPRVTQIRSLEVVTADTSAADTVTRPIHERIAEIVSDVPGEVWDRLPRDLSHRHDHYIHGED